MAVASADVRRSRSRLSARRVSRPHWSPARDGVIVQCWAGVYGPGGAKDGSVGPEMPGRVPKIVRCCRKYGTGRMAASVRYCARRAVWRASPAGKGAVRVMPRERAAMRMDVLGRATVGPLSLALWRLLDRGSALSPSPSASRRRLAWGLLPRRPVLVAGVPAPGVVSLRLEAVTEASVEAQPGVSEMTGHQPQAARLGARVVALVVDWTGALALGAAGGGGLGGRRPGERVRSPLRDVAYVVGRIAMMGGLPGWGDQLHGAGRVWRPWARERRASGGPIEDCARRRLGLRRPA